MSDRATPETDAKVKDLHRVPHKAFDDHDYPTRVPVGFARNLERQLSEAREERDRAINRQLSCEAAIVDYEKLFGHVPHEQLLLNMQNVLAKLAKCREALQKMIALYDGIDQQTKLGEFQAFARTTLNETA
jgi:hypothetical protein